MHKTKLKNAIFVYSENVNESISDGDSPTKRMTRLRARGGVRDKPPIIDEDEDDFWAPVVRKKKPEKVRKPPGERREKVDRPRKEHMDKEQERIDMERDVTTDETSLYFIVRHSKSPIASIVDDWIEQYKVNRDTALIALLQFFINASGCKGKIPEDTEHPMDHTAVIRKMTEEFDEVDIVNCILIHILSCSCLF